MANRGRKAARNAASDTLAQRRRYLQFSDADALLVADLREIVERNADALVDDFYTHLQRHDETRRLLGDPATVERLKGAQRRYLERLTSGRYDARYAADRERIGKVHERIGLSPQWYLGAYGLYLDRLCPHVVERYRDRPELAMRTCSALAKLLILDMQLVLDAYYITRERRAVERTEQLAAVGELAASIAHEVRNPLAGMKGALEVLRGELTAKPENVEIVDELLSQIGRLETLVRDLLTYARPRPIRPREFDLHELLDRVLRVHQEVADASQITLQRIYGPGTGRLDADPEQLEQVFLNLVQNAIQAMEDGGTLTVKTAADRRFLSVAFRDTGKGIPVDQQRTIFQPFFTTKHRGSGLGLSIVQKIVEGHEGTIEIDSEPGVATEMTVVLPRRRTG